MYYVLTQWMWFSRVFRCKSLIGVTSCKRLPDTPSDVHNELFNHVKEEEEKRAKKIFDTVVPRFLHFHHDKWPILIAIIIVSFINGWISFILRKVRVFSKIRKFWGLTVSRKVKSICWNVILRYYAEFQSGCHFLTRVSSCPLHVVFHLHVWHFSE